MMMIVPPNKTPKPPKKEWWRPITDLLFGNALNEMLESQKKSAHSGKKAEDKPTEEPAFPPFLIELNKKKEEKKEKQKREAEKAFRRWRRKQLKILRVLLCSPDKRSISQKIKDAFSFLFKLFSLPYFLLIFLVNLRLCFIVTYGYDMWVDYPWGPMIDVNMFIGDFEELLVKDYWGLREYVYHYSVSRTEAFSAFFGTQILGGLLLFLKEHQEYFRPTLIYLKEFYHIGFDLSYRVFSRVVKLLTHISQEVVAPLASQYIDPNKVRIIEWKNWIVTKYGLAISFCGFLKETFKKIDMKAFMSFISSWDNHISPYLRKKFGLKLHDAIQNVVVYWINTYRLHKEFSKIWIETNFDLAQHFLTNLVTLLKKFVNEQELPERWDPRGKGRWVFKGDDDAPKKKEFPK